MDEKPNKYVNLPIPTYEEATSSRPTTSQSRPRPDEPSNHAERQGLLGGGEDDDQDGSRSPTTRHSNYVPPTVESERSSFDSLDGLDNDAETNEIRREMQEMDIEEPDNNNGSHRSLLTYRFKRFTSFTNSFTSLTLPSLRRFIPSLPSMPSIPSMTCLRIDWQTVDHNRIVILGRLFGVFIIIGVLYVLIASDILSLGRNRAPGGQMFDPESVRVFVLNNFQDWRHIRSHYEHITKFPHVAGTEGSYVLGEWIGELFKKHQLDDVGMDRYDVYMNYPKTDGRKVLVDGPGDRKWEATLTEENDKTGAYHGYSKAGTVTGTLIYANYGSAKDFGRLAKEGIDVKGSVVLIRRTGAEGDLGSKVKAAHDAGAVGCLIFADPALDDPNEPSDRYLPPKGIQRDSVGLMSYVMGDPLSPGWSSGVSFKQRLSLSEAHGLVTIPSLPISWEDASHLLSLLQSFGKKMEGEWAGKPELEYWTGNQDSPKVRLQNEQDEVFYQPIYNVVGRIPGWEQSNKKIIVGNHRDSWCLGGAAPGSGTAAMLAMTRVFGELRKQTWLPLRTIEFVSWDAGEFNAAGSTEHVEGRTEELRHDAIAYLNVGTGVTGTDFFATGSPVFRGALRRALNRVEIPGSNGTVRQSWEEQGAVLKAMGISGDATPFQHITGTSSLDMSFKGANYPAGSCEDTYEWVIRSGDPGTAFDVSSILAQVWSLLILELADSPLLPFDIEAYHSALHSYCDDLLHDLEALQKANPNLPFTLIAEIKPLQQSIDFLHAQITQLRNFDNHWHGMIQSSGGFESSVMTVRRIDRNNRVANFESQLLNLPQPDKNGGATGPGAGNAGGLPERSQYKHSIYAPKEDDPYTAVIFPGVRYYLQKKEWDHAREEITRVAELIKGAAVELSV